MSSLHVCGDLAAYLEGVQEAQASFDHERVKALIGTCPACYDKVAEFFRLMDVPETEYLDETIDDLTLTLYNLVKALMTRPADDREEGGHDNVRFVTQPGDVEEYAREGQEMIDDVQDFVGADEVRGESMEGIRALVESSRARFDAAITLLERAVELGGAHALDCRNLMGILYLERGENDRAEECFRAVITAPAADLYIRKVQVHAMNNLSYLCVARDALDEAIRWARRSKALAEETDLDPFGSRFGLMYFYLLRNQSGDLDRAVEEIESLIGAEDSQRELRRCLKLPSNEGVRSLIAERGLGGRYAGIVD